MSSALRSPTRHAGTLPLGAAGLVVLASVGVAAAVGVTEAVVRFMGRNIPQPDLVTDYAVGWVWALALGASILVWPVRPTDRRWILLAWSAKALVTLGVMLAYEWNYEYLDAYSYFRASFEPHADPGAFALGSGTETINAIAWLHARLLTPSYHALKVSFSMVGLVATYVLYRGACLALRREEPRLLLLLAFFPSMLFWSSILGKDPIVLLGIALYCYGVLLWFRRRSPWAYAAMGAGLLVAMAIRLWLGPILVGPFVVLWVRCLPTGGMRAGATAGSALVGGAMFWRYRDQLLREGVAEVLDTVNTVSRGWAEGGSGQLLTTDLTSPAAFARFLPRGMFTALFRPLPGEVMNPFGLLAGMESLALLLLVGLAVWRTRLRDLAEPLTMWGVSLVLAWSAVYSILSYQNLGTAVRFRLQIIPVLLGLLAWMAWGRDAVARASRADLGARAGRGTGA